jgi:hypothetical protein
MKDRACRKMDKSVHRKLHLMLEEEEMLEIFFEEFSVL